MRLPTENIKIKNIKARAQKTQEPPFGITTRLLQQKPLPHSLDIKRHEGRV